MPLDGEPVAQRGNSRSTHTRDPAEARFCESVESGHTEPGRVGPGRAKLGLTAEPLRMDSQAKYAAVATGRGVGLPRLPAHATYLEKIWDHAGEFSSWKKAAAR